jgi:5-methyltetrahydrofolate--homocysteine methyltransferase
LGIKVPPERIIEAYREEKVDAIGLSGLLVKSAQQMIVTAQDLRTAGIDVPIMVGGAALTRKFTKNRIRPEYDGMVVYAKDAMDGLDLANKLMNPVSREVMQLEMEAEKEADASSAETVKPLPELTRVERSDIAIDNPVLVPPDLERHTLRNYPLSHILPYVNMQMLLGHHLGLRGSVEQLLASGDPKATDLKAVVDGIMQEAVRDGIIQAHAMYRFFPAQSSGNSIIIYDPENTSNILHTFTFPRQKVEPFLCLSDFLKPVESGEMDYVGFMVVTAGHGVRELSTAWKEQGDYLRSHALQSVALEVAEGLAERVHHMMRDIWGFPDPANMTMKQRHGARYQGIRVSFGYPACPDLEDQGPLFKLMQPEDIGVELTEGFMMEPEASVSAMVFSHPQAKYFNVEKA